MADNQRPGDNKPSLDDRAALLVHHISKIRAQKKITAVKRTELSVEVEVETQLFNQAKGDGGWDRKKLERWLSAASSSHRDLLEEREEDEWAFGVLGLPVQPDMFANAKTDTERDAAEAELTGWMIGRRGDDLVIPSNIHPMFHGSFTAGYQRAMEFNIMALAKGAEVVERMTAPNTQAPVNLNDGADAPDDAPAGDGEGDEEGEDDDDGGEGGGGDTGEGGETAGGDEGDKDDAVAGAADEEDPLAPDAIKTRADALRAAGFVKPGTVDPSDDGKVVNLARDPQKASTRSAATKH